MPSKKANRLSLVVTDDNEVEQAEVAVPTANVAPIDALLNPTEGQITELTDEDIAEMDRVAEMENRFAERYHRDQQAKLESEMDLQEAIDFDDTLKLVMTSGEAVAKYNLSNSAVRQAIRDGAIPARKSGGTWLILRKHADELWSKRTNA